MKIKITEASEKLQEKFNEKTFRPLIAETNARLLDGLLSVIQD